MCEVVHLCAEKMLGSGHRVEPLPDLVTVTKLLPGQCYQFTDCNALMFNGM